MTTMTIECDCGVAESFAIPLKENETMLGQHALGDFIIQQFDASHVCREQSAAQGLEDYVKEEQ